MRKEQHSDSWKVYDTFQERKRGFNYRRADTVVPKPFEPFILHREIPKLNRCSGIFVRHQETGETLPLQSYFEARLTEQKTAVPASCCVSVENARFQKMKELRTYFDTLMELNQIKRPREAFNRWIFEKRTEETIDRNFRDHLIASSLTVSSGLLRELLDDAKHVEDEQLRNKLCTEICIDLAKKSSSLVGELSGTIEKLVSDAHQISTAPHSPVTTVKSVVDTGVVQIVFHGRVSHELLANHFRKLEKLFLAYNGEDSKEILSDRLFSVMQRYRSATGYRPNEGSGHHCATPPEVLDTLAEVIGVEMECFASPFNSHFSHFCTAFGDTDVFFGSLGSFFTFHPVEGSFEVGPPFVEELMEAMRLHIETLLAASDRPLSFAIIIPEWIDPMTPCIDKIYRNETGTLKRAIVVPKEKHAYHDGFQHTLRKTLFKPVHNTLVLVLQNEAGAIKWPVTDVVEATILNSWAKVAENLEDNPLVPQKRSREDN